VLTSVTHLLVSILLLGPYFTGENFKTEVWIELDNEIYIYYVYVNNVKTYYTQTKEKELSIIQDAFWEVLFIYFYLIKETVTKWAV
jgi:hypothetical protein